MRETGDGGAGFIPSFRSIMDARLSAPARPPDEEDPIDPTDWDLIVLGSGLAECLVAR